MVEQGRRPNRLINETSAYLLQHAYNPVDWYPWGPEAFRRAAQEGKPIFLSIGYSACHWCHVMERESFEDPEIAELLNREFIPVKVDREERPDVDQLYMVACQVLTGHGGWPLSVFLTPDGKPFFAGTYFPPAPRHGLPSFRQVLEAIARAWKEQRREIEERAENIWSAMAQVLTARRLPEAVSEPRPSWVLLSDVVRRLETLFDERYGGFGGAPKFPRTAPIQACLWNFARSGNPTALQMAVFTMEAMASGGLYDQLGGGFHRYSTDSRWLVPHFEKMLYDNALLLALYTEGYIATRKELFREVIEGTAGYLLREMRLDGGAFAASQGADSEGEEGKYYVWSWDELVRLLTAEELRLAELLYGVSPRGNWEGRNILFRNLSVEQAAESLKIGLDDARRLAASLRQKLLEARARRVPPGRDEKVVVSWNALTVDALVRAGMALGREDLVGVARAAAAFLWDNLVDETGSGGDLGVFHSWCKGRRSVPGFLDDYAALAGAFLTLYEACGDDLWLQRALLIIAAARRRFELEPGVWSMVSQEHDIPLRDLADVHDSATPSSVALWMGTLGRFAWLLPEHEFAEVFEKTWDRNRPIVEREPIACLSALIAACFYEAPPAQISFEDAPAGLNETDVMRLIWSETYLPWRVIRWQKGAAAGQPAATDRPVRVTVCLGTSCFPPVERLEQLQDQLRRCVEGPGDSG